MQNGLDEDASFAVVTEEALRSADIRGIRERLLAQPAWSDLPLIILTRRTSTLEKGAGVTALFETAGNATLLERPFHPASFVSVARAAFRSRQRQFEAFHIGVPRGG